MNTLIKKAGLEKKSLKDLVEHALFGGILFMVLLFGAEHATSWWEDADLIPHLIAGAYLASLSRVVIKTKWQVRSTNLAYLISTASALLGGIMWEVVEFGMPQSLHELLPTEKPDLLSAIKDITITALGGTLFAHLWWKERIKRFLPQQT